MCLLWAVALCCACSDNSETAEPSLTLQNTEVAAEAQGGEYVVEVTSSSEWTVSECAAWVTPEVSAGHDRLVLRVNENLERSPRSLTLTLANAENLSQDIHVRQEAYAYDENHRYKLPVVFHVLYWRENNEQNNVKEGHLQKVLERVNRHYKNCGVDLPVEFVMATEDPDGNRLEEPGVERVKWASTTMDCLKFMRGEDPAYKALLWNPDRYVNVVLFQFTDIQLLGQTPSPWLPEPYELEGISQVPGGTDLDSNPAPHCVSLNNRYIYDLPEGEDAYSVSDVGWTLAHELGHFLGLFHAFNQLKNGSTDTNEDTDYCTDTPPYNKTKYDRKLYSYLYSHPGGITSKSSDAYKQYVMRENSQTGEEFRSTNIMDYAISDFDRFTPEQAERIRYILHHALFLPGPKDYTGTRLESTKSVATGFRFIPHLME